MKRNVRFFPVLLVKPLLFRRLPDMGQQQTLFLAAVPETPKPPSTCKIADDSHGRSSRHTRCTGSRLHSSQDRWSIALARDRGLTAPFGPRVLRRLLPDEVIHVKAYHAPIIISRLPISGFCCNLDCRRSASHATSSRHLHISWASLGRNNLCKQVKQIVPVVRDLIHECCQRIFYDMITALNHTVSLRTISCYIHRFNLQYHSHF